MKLEHLERAFERMGARLQLESTPLLRVAHNGYALDIGHDRHGQFFALHGSPEALKATEFEILQLRPRERHLLLLSRSAGEKAIRKDRFLCGHDEREWFVAAVPGQASTVLQAREALKPTPVKLRQTQLRLNAEQASSRHNAAFRRQGEWFFLPLRHPLIVDTKKLLHREPLQRGGGKPHLVEHVFRTGGEVVYTCQKYPHGISAAQHARLLQSDPKASRWPWLQRRRNPGVYARGTVRHPDHATIVLHDWHQVFMNTENQAPAMSHVAFLD